MEADPQKSLAKLMAHSNDHETQQPLSVTLVNNREAAYDHANSNGNEDNELNITSYHCPDEFPPGYRFCPLDGELIVHYLMKKIKNEKLPHDRIKEVNLYQSNPNDLSAMYEVLGEKEWYFFTPRERKYRNGSRPNRAAGDGYWKATGADQLVKYKGKEVGCRKALVFYQGKPPKGEKTNWIMHEFRANQPPRNRNSLTDMRLDDWVLCRIYKKVEKGSNSDQIRNEKPKRVVSSPTQKTNDFAGSTGYGYNGIQDSSGLMMMSSQLEGFNIPSSNFPQVFPQLQAPNYLMDHVSSMELLGGFEQQQPFYHSSFPNVVNPPGGIAFRSNFFQEEKMVDSKIGGIYNQDENMFFGIRNLDSCHEHTLFNMYIDQNLEYITSDETDTDDDNNVASQADCNGSSMPKTD